MKLREFLRPGMTIAIGDGVGAPRYTAEGVSIWAELSALAREFGDTRLVIGWLAARVDDLDAEAFSEVVALMPGWGMRGVLRCSTARFVPTPLSGIAALLGGPLRPDVLITRLVERDDGLHFSTEVSWQRDLVAAGVPVLALVDRVAPNADAGPPLDPAGVCVIGYSADGPLQFPSSTPDDVHEALADAVLRFVPDGARLQYGPGQLGTALLTRTQRAVVIDTGMLTDAVVDLDQRGLLVGMPSSTYLFGTDVLYDWADDKPILHGIEYTHDHTRLSRGTPLIAVNMAIEIDPVGQVNVEGVGDKVIGGIGGHADYCAAARTSRGGLSIIAVPSSGDGRSPLVERLSRPVSTPAYDIDVIVTESGHADLRGADWVQRRRLVTALFE